MLIRQAIFALAGLCCLLMTGPLSAQALKIVGTDWAPYVNADIPRNGVAAEMVTTAFRKAGYPSQLYIDGWPSALTAVQIGDFDLIAGLWYAPEREASIAYSEPFMENRLRFMAQANSGIQFNEREDLMGLRVGIVEDFAYSEEPYDTTGIEVVVGGSVGDNVERLLAGEVDLVVGDELVLQHEADKRRAGTQVVLLPRVLDRRALHIGVSRKRADHAELIAAFNQAIAEMKADGSYASMLANYRISN